MDRSMRALFDTVSAQLADIRETVTEIASDYENRYGKAAIVDDARVALNDLEQACAVLRRAVREWK